MTPSVHTPAVPTLPDTKPEELLVTLSLALTPTISNIIIMQSNLHFELTIKTFIILLLIPSILLFFRGNGLGVEAKRAECIGLSSASAAYTRRFKITR